VHLEHAPPDDALYAEPLFGPGNRRLHVGARQLGPLRRAGATARSMLVSAAAETWQVEPKLVVARANGAVIHGPTAAA